MLFDVDICSLSEKFYNDYPFDKYPEILRKSSRPYTCLLIDFHSEYLICVPFRSSINHNEAFHFSGTKRSKKTMSGLDYKKSVLIKNEQYIDSTNATVDSDEYKIMIKNIEKIAKEVNEYINIYVGHIKGESILHNREYKRRYEYSTLPYFHDVLGIT